MYVIYEFLSSNGVVMLSKESLKEVKVDFRISFIRYEKKKMYLIRSDGSLLILAHFSVEECDIVRQDLPDEAVEFPLKERHYELEVCVDIALIALHTVVVG